RGSRAGVPARREHVSKRDGRTSALRAGAGESRRGCGEARVRSVGRHGGGGAARVSGGAGTVRRHRLGAARRGRRNGLAGTAIDERTFARVAAGQRRRAAKHVRADAQDRARLRLRRRRSNRRGEPDVLPGRGSLDEHVSRAGEPARESRAALPRHAGQGRLRRRRDAAAARALRRDRATQRAHGRLRRRRRPGDVAAGQGRAALRRRRRGARGTRSQRGGRARPGGGRYLRQGSARRRGGAMSSVTNEEARDVRLGISGSVAKRFQDSKLTPLFAIAGLLLGVFAVLITPREEEPQIDVTFANVFVPFPGASAVEVENVVAVPLEQVLAEIEGVEHTYSVSQPGMAVLTVQFEVGEPRNDAIVRLYNAVFSNLDYLPQNLGVLQPLVKPMGIDDVPIVTITLWTEDPERGAHDLARVAHSIEAELKRVPGTRDVYTIGAPDRVVHVRLDPQRMANYGLSLDALRASLLASNVVTQAGAIVAANTYTPVTAGAFLANAEDVAELVVGVVEGRAVYLDDVAEVVSGPDQPEQYVWFGTGAGAAAKGLPKGVDAPAVTIAIAKKPGENASDIADAVIERVEALRGTYVPDGVEATVTRNYGQTANDKARQLINKLIFATASVIVLVAVALGWREAIIVGA